MGGMNQERNSVVEELKAAIGKVQAEIKALGLADDVGEIDPVQVQIARLRRIKKILSEQLDFSRWLKTHQKIPPTMATEVVRAESRVADEALIGFISFLIKQDPAAARKCVSLRHTARPGSRKRSGRVGAFKRTHHGAHGGTEKK